MWRIFKAIGITTSMAEWSKWQSRNYRSSLTGLDISTIPGRRGVQTPEPELWETERSAWGWLQGWARNLKAWLPGHVDSQEFVFPSLLPKEMEKYYFVCCSCGTCMHECGCTYRYMSGRVPRGLRSHSRIVFSLFIKTESLSWTQNPIIKSSQANQFTPEIPFLPSKHWNCRWATMPTLQLCGCWKTKFLSSHLYGNHWSTEPYSQARDREICLEEWMIALVR